MRVLHVDQRDDEKTTVVLGRRPFRKVLVVLPDGVELECRTVFDNHAVTTRIEVLLAGKLVHASSVPFYVRRHGGIEAGEAAEAPREGSQEGHGPGPGVPGDQGVG